MADRLAAAGVEPGEFRSAFAAALADELAATGAVGLKSIAAYRVGLDLDPHRPAQAELAGAVAAALGRSGRAERLADPVITRELLWAGAETGLPIQLHIGYGDRDVRLPRSDPALLSDLLQQLPPVPIMLLHCWPYQRQASYLAAVWPQVYLDVGLTLGYVGPTRAAAVLAEAMELTPFGKLLYSSDAFGLPELYLLGAHTFRTALSRLLDERVAAGEWAAADARRIARAGLRAERAPGLPAGRPVTAAPVWAEGPDLAERWAAALAAELPAAVRLRHELHARPELSGAEAATAERVVAAIVADRPGSTQPAVSTVAGTGRLVRIGPASGPAVAVRAELDGLPVHERTGIAWASTTPGAMHACGHDVHMAAAVALAAPR